MKQKMPMVFVKNARIEQKHFLKADTVHDVYVGDSLESQKAKFDEFLTKF